MSTNEQDLLHQLRETFKVEAQEHLQAMSWRLLELEKQPATEQPGALVEEIFREAHSLKGAARAVSFPRIESICQALESVFAAWKRQELAPVVEQFDMLHQALDTIGQLVLAPEATPPEPIAPLLQQLDGLQSGNVSHPTARPEPAVAAAPAAEPAAPADSVRIATAKLDALILQAEEMLAVKLTTGQRAAELQQARLLLEQWNREWTRLQSQLHSLHESLGQPPGAARLLELLEHCHANIKPLETRLTALANTTTQDSHVTGKLVDDLLDGSKKLLLLPFATLLGSLPKLVRDIAREQDRPTDLVLQGGEIEIDKRILEEMKDPLIHLVRNCLDHGIEPPAERARQNKPPRATITVTVTQVEGNKVEICVGDDGRGIDALHVKAAAAKHGVISTAEAGILSETEALPLIFMSGVSTAPIITEISGRGLGLAIVREKADKLGGHVSVQTERGRGTTFRMLLPVTLATFRGVFAQAAAQMFVVPTINVDGVGRVKPDEIKTVEGRETIPLNGRTLAFVPLADVLGLPPAAEPGNEPWQAYLVLSTGDQRIAFGVDAVLDEAEVLVKRLSKPLVRVRHIAGATVTGSGKVVPILNVTDLLLSARNPRAGARPLPARPPEQQKLILVVEDSVTSRMLLKNILESAGYRVRTAVDGVDALDQLRSQPIDLVVSDVDMPRLNGFALTEKIRSDKQLANLPVVLVTALGSEADRARGVDVGANAYIVKSSFDQSNLREIIRQLV